MPPQLFNLDDDPEEMTDLASDPVHAATLAELDAELRTRLDPEEVDAEIKAMHAAIVARHGGREKILSRGSMGATPPPGTGPEVLRTE